MGISQYNPLLEHFDFKGIILPINDDHEEKGVVSNNGSLLSKVLEDQAKRRRALKVQSKRPRRVLKKRTTRRLGGFRGRNKGIVRRVKTLKRLIPHSESNGLEGLFSETADYILALQMRVRVMQIMVSLLSGGDDSDEQKSD